MLLLIATLGTTALARPLPRPTVPQQHFERAAMGTLGSWAVANLAVGTAGWTLADNPRTRGFWQMNTGWNVVNLALAGGGLLGTSRVDWPGLSSDQLLARQKRFRNTLLINAGVDLLYIGGGMVLRQWALGKNKPAAGLGRVPRTPRRLPAQLRPHRGPDSASTTPAVTTLENLLHPSCPGAQRLHTGR